jgi:uncharacterized membrane protein
LQKKQKTILFIVFYKNEPFLFTDMMRLKRIPTKYGSKKEKKVEAFISRHAGGMCFDFQQKDTNM